MSKQTKMLAKDLVWLNEIVLFIYIHNNLNFVSIQTVPPLPKKEMKLIDKGGGYASKANLLKMNGFYCCIVCVDNSSDCVFPGWSLSK